MGRPIILHERIPLNAAPAAGQPSQTVRSDPTLITPPEAMRVDHIVLDEETAEPAGVLVKPSLVLREYWPTIPTVINTYNNLSRDTDADEYGEFWLADAFLLRRGHSIAIEIQNRVVGLSCNGYVMFQGHGFKSKRPHDLVIEFDIAAGSNDGVTQVFGGQATAKNAGREDVLITAVAWKRGLDSPGWNPRRIGMKVMPSYGNIWGGLGGTARGAGAIYPPLYVYSNIRGPRVAAWYSPEPGLQLEQGDEVTFEFTNMALVERIALLSIVGTSLAE